MAIAWQRILAECPDIGKAAYATLDRAQKEANKMTWRNKQRGQPAKVKPYVCKHCGMFHIGRGPKGGDPDTSFRP